ncbi:MAG: UDP-N-acetylmuramoyl-tripeptide--D-alanyl-D-alanine ligase [Hydrogenophaga sp.]|jgi:UDP-N-acetylmuramoyl-tripeptide--D-alanyl-D-alanine ligase|uniref:UDP-N-acetylmuramoyl-tripeptide--D-alanyl-D- alanine ligase n=1 Tax=Hydrogenophaga sp. TaxID=1904254 RepID=UPI001DDB9D84|nr:UDP-N-acetylmuramoyl-tripeptide--D-alanyl-D-alanine ligase [Hydrogenophaga sp.]MBW0170576.1 UDP-N-acetylmuramoyl-tripeptide--D-alanyl-D-alanine ligase [Hydrogenophaga sp.]MBW0185405.1 UDP-N-acetylmuramoyl-tripeptide--D-alanyl-D-alanine ligase [Hydrogenophaga sp.]
MKTLGQCLLQLEGARVVGQPDLPFTRVHTDTRSLQPGDLFVALKGERFDAHDFLPQAQGQGALAALADHGLAAAGLPGVEVPDTRRALGELARLWRGQFALPLIAVTGSNGKTTVTQMIASILRASAGDAAHATQGNFNNDIGVPLTLLRLNASHRCSVVELGMNHPGEIAELAALALPTVALVNNAQREHQEFMATVEAVARENGQVIQALASDGVAVFPSDDTYSPLWRELAAGRRVVTFSDSDPGADVMARRAEWQEGAWALDLSSPAGTATVRLQIAGRHNVRNALAATAAALAAGVSLEAVVRGLNAFEPVGGRSRALALRVGDRAITLIDDTYNANPDSVRAAIDVLAELPAPRLLALGDMGEVGEQGLAFHDEVLRHAQARGIEAVHVAGDWMRQASAQLPGVTHWVEVPAMAGAVCAAVKDDRPVYRSVLVKGSRFMRMERVVQALQALDASAQKDKKDNAHAA